MKKNKDIEFLKRIVLDASKLITDDFDVKIKDEQKGDLVTNLDLEIEKFLINEINKEYSDFGIVSEEFNSKKELMKNCFVIDPIDGTINFSVGLDLWGIQIAMIKDGEVTGSVIFAPKLNELYWADESGAYLNGKRIFCKKFEPNKSLYTINAGNYVPSVVRMKKILPHHRMIWCACVTNGWIAKGVFSTFVLKADNYWDYLPGQYLVKQAGGFVFNEKGFHIATSDEEMIKLFRKYCKDYKDDKVFTSLDEKLNKKSFLIEV